jgi:excisionase family DNA binding protein
MEKEPTKRQHLLNELMNKKLLDSKEVCEILGISLPTLRRWMMRGDIKHVKVSKYIRFPSAEIFRLVQNQEVLSVLETAKILGTTPLTIRNMIKRGEIVAVRVSGGHYHITKLEIERIIGA